MMADDGIVVPGTIPRLEAEAKLGDFQKFVMELLRQNQDLADQLVKCKRSLIKEEASVEHRYDLREKSKNELRELHEEIEREKFILVLVDGDADGAVFNDDFLQGDVITGAGKAAQMFKCCVDSFVKSRGIDASGIHVVVKIYLNVDGLAGKLSKCGLIREPAAFRKFLQAFTMSQPRFEVIDVGDGKEKADCKVQDTFRMMLKNVYCAHIIFAGCHDSGYVNYLQPHEHDDKILKRLTLLETTPFTPAFKRLAFRKTRFEGLFRMEKLPVDLIAIKALPLNYGSSVIPPAPSDIRSAAVAPHAPQSILLNQHDERIDTMMAEASAAADRNVRLRQQVRNQKFCYDWHLNGACHWESNGLNCKLQHVPVLTEDDRLALRHMARKSPCPTGLECRNFQCTRGHTCPDGSHCSGGACKFKHWHQSTMDIKAVYLLEEGKKGRKTI